MYNSISKYNNHICNYKYKITSIEKIVNSNIIAVTIDLGFDILIRQKIRLLGIHVPNTNSQDADEIQYALLVKQRVREWCTKYLEDDEHISYELRCSIADFKDSKNNLLGELWYITKNSETNINKWLVDNFYAVPTQADKSQIHSNHECNKKIIKEKGEYLTYIV